MSVTTIEAAKAQAKALRAALTEVGQAISHAQALELVARQNGARDWNTLRAALSEAELSSSPMPFALDARVEGRYLGIAYQGRIVSIARAGTGYQIAIQLDQPIDAVKFDSFSNMRRRIRGVIGPDGRSHRKTSDGQPQLIVEPTET